MAADNTCQVNQRNDPPCLHCFGKQESDQDEIHQEQKIKRLFWGKVKGVSG